ncbi:hypothetical protein K443DRAFT_684480 [Laccaria amethystina LaAM-08-1]|uniref:Dienelactone hydrolase domain-containing protein n=1 Tax=Laccaria amethystina LaAM-08-1 TaxID=1095629 RepID=A0A0C9X7H6_9AGAR|nr:hypothetical protein K443DRAFT_684480 [Laccaria amethystina LaAM-08-1]
MSTVLAGPPGECCAKGFKHSGEPAGTTVTIADLRTYLSEPRTVQSEGPKKVILFFSDIFGPYFLNNQLLQDYYASQGYHVLGVDYFFGDAVHLHTEPGFELWDWIDKCLVKAKEVTPKWIDAVIDKYGPDTKYYAAGYCFGAPFTMELAAGDRIVAAAFVHPAYLTDDHFKKLKKPLLLSLAAIDPTFPVESRRRAEDILDEIKATYHVQIFGGVEHGFATRGDPSVEVIRWSKEESARGIAGWFNRFN